MVGPLNVKDTQPLPPDLEEFVNNSGGHGFIIVSFGSMVASILPREKVDMLADALGKDQTVILKAPPGAGKTTMVHLPSWTVASTGKIRSWLFSQGDLQRSQQHSE